MKLTSFNPNPNSKIFDFAGLMFTFGLIYPFIMMQTKLMCEITPIPSKRRYLGLNDICLRLPKICGY